MSNFLRQVPTAAYGILDRQQAGSMADGPVEQIRMLGYAVVDGGYSGSALQDLSRRFDAVRQAYVATHGRDELQAVDELNNVRMMLRHDPIFLRLAMNERLLEVVGRLIAGKYMLNQQNGVINPSGESYNQGSWHRDLPYQHFTSSTPLAVNALFCVDEFTRENGATFVLPGSHHTGSFPSADYIERNAVQVEAPAGHFIVLDCMAFHAGGRNCSQHARRAVNHVYNIPFFKQQIRIPSEVDGSQLSERERELLGFTFQEPRSITGYLASRRR